MSKTSFVCAAAVILLRQYRRWAFPIILRKSSFESKSEWYFCSASLQSTPHYSWPLLWERPLGRAFVALRIAEVNSYASFSMLSFEGSASLTCVRLVERRDRKSDWSSVSKRRFWAARRGLWAHGMMVSSGL